MKMGSTSQISHIAGVLGRTFSHGGRSVSGMTATLAGGAQCQSATSAMMQLVNLRAFAGVPESIGLPLSTDRPRLVILGTGWAAARVAMDIDPKLYDLTVVSLRNHMVFTPLLASACVGTLEARAVAQPITRLQPALYDPGNKHIVAEAHTVKPYAREVLCRSEDGLEFGVTYDKLVIATGSQGSTFGIPGVKEHAHFLRDVRDAEAIRNDLLANWMHANIPGRTRAERLRMLTTLVVGGGPTGVEFAGEAADLINRELFKIDPERSRDSRVVLVEAAQMLGSFDVRLRQYAAGKLIKAGVQLKKGMVKEMFAQHVVLQSGEEIPFGTCIWSTGVGPTEFTMGLPFAKTPRGRIAVDEHMRVLVSEEMAAGTSQDGAAVSPALGPSTPDQVSLKTPEHGDEAQPAEALEALPDVYALGDCCACVDNPLPALAQVAEQQGRYLARMLNKEAKGEAVEDQPFVYKQLGMMASIGGKSAVLELGSQEKEWFSTGGFWAWVSWRGAYLTRLGTFRNRVYVAVNWALTLVFGRDVSRW
eukprot:CAMPEP_0206135826 /NCGR_PEP_ID=MMETSP1473-20131121/1091_1 /ASSEMBLY_ACC=CAM_ASM_001109 /TAXON_ID=1461547 /ORGANISM="Stichococcus sp, Strain RCC1054" /LENGTH=532 /DNA_ID=CAMNT_0053527941 /DNA_START=118 /DNA_END=1716 /DNA_ORIENTATION=-